MAVYLHIIMSLIIICLVGFLIGREGNILYFQMDGGGSEKEILTCVHIHCASLCGCVQVFAVIIIIMMIVFLLLVFNPLCNASSRRCLFVAVVVTIVVPAGACCCCWAME